MLHSASSDIASAFNEKSNTGCFLLTMRLAQLASRFIVGGCCINVSHMKRVQLVILFTIVSYVGVAFAAS